MAEKRMFSKSVVQSDAFLEMPLSTQALYLHLSMEADDDGFVSAPKKIARMIGASEDDIKILLTKRFILAFESGIVVIKHWRINNYIPKDRYKPTMYQEEFKTLKVKDNNAYTELYTDCIQDVYNLDTQIRLDKIRLDKNRLDNIIYTAQSESDCAYVNENEKSVSKNEEGTLKASKKKNDEPKHKHGKYQNVLLKDKELESLKADFQNWDKLIDFLDEYIEMKGYKAKSHYLAIRKWVVEAVKREDLKKGVNDNTNNTTLKSEYEKARANLIAKYGEDYV